MAHKKLSTNDIAKISNEDALADFQTRVRHFKAEVDALLETYDLRFDWDYAGGCCSSGYDELEIWDKKSGNPFARYESLDWGK
jgi:hypothetical protein